MKILAIRLKNLASIEGTYEIDFTAEPLHSAGIFAISGPTGSGKSTILDALCLALFDKAPRFAATSEKVTLADVGEERIQQTDVRNILRRGMGEGFAEVDFIGVDGYRYSSHWTVYRARRKSTGALQNQVLSVKNIDTDEPLQGTKTELLNRLAVLVGLTYEQFTRTVLLAQNDFATFLKSRDDAKAELLEKLTGTEVYSRISMAVFTHNKEAQGALNDLQLRMGEVALLSNEELSEIKKKKRTCENEKEERLQLVRLMERKKKWNEQYHVLYQHEKSAREKLEEAEKAWTDASDRIELLAGIDSVQAAKPLVIERNNMEHSLSSQRVLLQKIREELSAKDVDRKRQQELNSVMEAKLKLVQSDMQAIAPLVVRARALDVRLGEAEKSLAKAEQDWRKDVNAQQLVQEAYAGKQRRLDDLTFKVKSLDEWIARYECHATMIQRMDYVLSLLEKGESSGKRLRASEVVLKESDASLLNAKKTLIILEKDLDISRKGLDEMKNSQDTLLRRLEDKQIEAVRKKVEALLALKERLTEALRIKALCEVEEKEAARWKEKLYAWDKELAVKTLEVSRLTKEIDVMKVQLEVVRKVYDNARIALSESVTQLREHLQAGEACPVCGSTEHPYAGDEKVDLVLRKVLEEFNNLTENLERQSRLQISLEKDRNYLGERLKEADSEIKAHSQAREKQMASLAHLTEGLIGEISLSDRLREVSAELDLMKKEEVEYAALMKQAKAVEQQIKESLAKDEQLKEAVRKQEQAYRTLLAEQEKEMALREQYRVSYEEAVCDAKKEISVDNWQALWLENPDTFKEQLQKLLRLWREKHTEMETVQKQCQQLSMELEGDGKLLQSLAEHVAKAVETVDSARSVCALLKTERAALLSGQLADDVEQQYKVCLRDAQEGYEASAKKLAEFVSACTELDGRIRQIESGIRKGEEELIGLQRRLQQWLEQYNGNTSSVLDERGLLELLSKEADWISEERKALNNLQNACTKAKATLEERQRQYLDHLADAHILMADVDEFELFAEQIEREKKRLDGIDRELFELHSRLLLQEQNKKRLKAFEKELKEKQETANRWAKLNDLIGQANGEKFKVIAQGYTLNVLLRHANKHLGYLSSRYKLQQVPGSLALQVIDRDMCDEVRTVYSLSGGESFLISLALALGLSSLSSNNMKVESLFIDEGFGSLDADSLRMAMEALEQLQTQGRKIGVISHVREMSERISTQIVLSRTANGKSKVTVVGR